MNVEKKIERIGERGYREVAVYVYKRKDREK